MANNVSVMRDMWQKAKASAKKKGGKELEKLIKEFDSGLGPELDNFADSYKAHNWSNVDKSAGKIQSLTKSYQAKIDKALKSGSVKEKDVQPLVVLLDKSDRNGIAAQLSLLLQEAENIKKEPKPKAPDRSHQKKLEKAAKEKEQREKEREKKKQAQHKQHDKEIAAFHKVLDKRISDIKKFQAQTQQVLTIVNEARAEVLTAVEAYSKAVLDRHRLPLREQVEKLLPRAAQAKKAAASLQKKVPDVGKETKLAKVVEDDSREFKPQVDEIKSLIEISAKRLEDTIWIADRIVQEAAPAFR